MKKLLYGLLCLSFAAFLTACGGGDEAADTTDEPSLNKEEPSNDHVGDEETAEGQAADESPPSADAGEAKADFQKSCAACHGADLTSGSAPDLNAIGAKYSKEEILNIIENGSGSMPGGLLKGEEAERVAEWLATMK